MDKQDFEVLVSELLQQFDSAEQEPHEIYERLRQTLDQMRAFGMPVPDDLLRLERELSDGFAHDAHDAKDAKKT